MSEKGRQFNEIITTNIYFTVLFSCRKIRILCGRKIEMIFFLNVIFTFSQPSTKNVCIENINTKQHNQNKQNESKYS